MNYTEALQEHTNKYNELKTKYDEMILSNQYARITSSMAFEFLSAKQTCETLEVFNELQNSPRLNFNSVEEAEVLSRNISRYTRSSKTLLDDAAYLNTVATLAEQINALVNTSPYLNKSLGVCHDKRLSQLAYECLEKIPKFPKYASFEFRYHFVESCLFCLKEEDMDKLVARKVIKAKDVEHLSRIENPETEEEKKYEANLAHLCLILNRPVPLVEVKTVRLKGVTFKNEDGSNRQDVIKEIAEAKKNGQTIKLDTEEYIFQDPEKKIEAQPAIRILWNGKVAGNLAADLVKSIKEDYINPTVEAEYGVITGGSDDFKALGMEIKLHIHAAEKIAKAEKSETIEEEATK